MCWNKAEIGKKVHSIIDKFADRGLRSLAVARQVNEIFTSLCFLDDLDPIDK